MGFTFKKAERLNSKKLIDELYSRRHPSLMSYPLSLSWMKASSIQEFPVSVLLTVSKRNFRKSVERNRIKRLLREAYRINKHPLYSYLNQKNLSIVLLINFVAKEAMVYQEIEIKLKSAFERLIIELEKISDSAG